jgi:hypothetical protein
MEILMVEKVNGPVCGQFPENAAGGREVAASVLLDVRAANDGAGAVVSGGTADVCCESCAGESGEDGEELHVGKWLVDLVWL